MKVFRAALAAAAAVAAVRGEAANPLSKVLELLGGLAAKARADGEAEEKAYQAYFEWCDDVASNGQRAVDSAKQESEKLSAQIAKLSSDIEEADGRISSLASSAATAEKELKEATAIREKEASDFEAGERELVETLDVLGRASGILRKELSKPSAALAQIDMQNLGSVLQAVGTVLDAASFSAADRRKLAAFVQAHVASDGDDDEAGAPAAAAYSAKSGGIVEVLEDMRDKAEEQLRDLRKAEANNRHNYELLRQAINDQLAADNKDLEEEKAAKAKASEGKATAVGDMEVAQKDLARATEALATARSTCMQAAANHEATVAAREEELKVIAEATQILQETSGGAAAKTYAFVQLSSELRRRGLGAQVAGLVRALAKKHRSAALAQLASRVAAAAKFRGEGGEGPFGKIKGMISDMIAKLQDEMESEATEKAYCDEQMSKTSAKKSDLEDDVAKLTGQIDSAAAKSASLKEQVKELQGQLAALAKEQAEMDRIRQEGHADYVQTKADLELGLSGVRKALTVLRDYYGGGEAALLQDESKFTAMMQQPAMPEQHSKATGAGQSITSILEVVEDDFAKNLAKEESEEASMASNYDKETQENKLERTSMEQAVKYKEQESKALDATISEVSGDRDTLNTELAAVSEYDTKLKERCVAKPESYEERKARREAEISGLKEALTVLEDETALVQRARRGGRRAFRGAALAVR